MVGTGEQRGAAPSDHPVTDQRAALGLVREQVAEADAARRSDEDTRAGTEEGSHAAPAHRHPD